LCETNPKTEYFTQRTQRIQSELQILMKSIVVSSYSLWALCETNPLETASLLLVQIILSFSI
jgi:hypothetical protein